MLAQTKGFTISGLRRHLGYFSYNRQNFSLSHY